MSPHWAAARPPFARRAATRRRGYDVDAIKTALPVPEMLEQLGIHLTADQVDKRRVGCPIHQGVSDTSLSWSEDGLTWHCFGCDRGGSSIDLLMELEGLEFKEAVDRAAKMAGLKPGRLPGEKALQRRREERQRAAEKRAREQALKNNEAAKAADRRFWELRQADDKRGMHLGHKYLASRGLQVLVDEQMSRWSLTKRDATMWITYEPDGSVAVPIWGFHDWGAIVNLATRKVSGFPAKVMTIKGATTLGTLGDWRPLVHLNPDGAMTQVALVEGVFDLLTALVSFPRGTVCLGANGADNLPKIVAALAACRIGAPGPIVADVFMRLPLVLVPHDDGPGGAGARAHAAVLAELQRLGKTNYSVFDLGGHNDLNDWWRARLGSGSPTS